MRRALIAALLVAAVTTSAGAAGQKVLLGISGDLPRFKDLTGQNSSVHQAFLGWGQGQSYGAPWRTLLSTFGPIPMLHLGTAAKPPSKKQAITPAQLAAGRGDGYIAGLAGAIHDFGRLVYVRPMAEMNNPVNLWSYERKHDAAHAPAQYKRAFCRIYVLLHGGSAAQIDARLRQLGLGPYGHDLPSNPYPGSLRVVWNPLAGIEQGANPAARYYPGDACTDLVGNDMFSSSVGGGSFEENQALYDAHPRKPYSLPEWGLQGVDDPGFVRRICEFVKTHARTEMAAYYESRGGSIYDLGSKPQSKAAYRACITPLGTPASSLPPPPTVATIPVIPVGQLSITPDPASGPAPLTTTLSVQANLGKPIAQWELVYGDGTFLKGTGDPTANYGHTYAKDGVYQATIIAYLAPPFTGTAVRFLASAKIEVGEEPGTLLALRPTPSSGRAPLAVSFHTIVNLPRPVVSWQILWGDGDQRGGAGKPPSFLGHTYTKKGAVRAVLIVYLAPPFTGTAVRFLTFANISVS